MKTIAKYVCEECGAEYSSERACKECEARHRKPVSVKSFRRFRDEDGGYPYTIIVFFDDGKKLYFDYSKMNDEEALK